MMHDLTLNRTSTGLGPVRENNWHGCIDTLTTKAEPHQPIPRFCDVLDLLIQPEAASIEGLYMIVDIKVRLHKKRISCSHELNFPSLSSMITLLKSWMC